MAKKKFPLDGTFQQLATGPCVITIDRKNPDTNIEVADNVGGTVATIKSDVEIKNGDQFIQNDAVPTFAKGDGWIVTVDGDIFN